MRTRVDLIKEVVFQLAIVEVDLEILLSVATGGRSKDIKRGVKVEQMILGVRGESEKNAYLWMSRIDPLESRGTFVVSHARNAGVRDRRVRILKCRGQRDGRQRHQASKHLGRAIGTQGCHAGLREGDARVRQESLREEVGVRHHVAHNLALVEGSSDDVARRTDRDWLGIDVSSIGRWVRALRIAVVNHVLDLSGATL